MSPIGLRARRRLLVPGLFLLGLFACGCGGTRHPVAGRVLLNGKPLEGAEGSVVLKPDAVKGNKTKAASYAKLQADGSFTVETDGKPGAPAGWYKVIVTATKPGANPNEDTPLVVPARYATEADTPLSVEVVASPEPDCYDLKLSP